MRILMVSAAILPFWQCGVAMVVHDLCMHLRDAGNETGLFALDIQEKTDRFLTLEGSPCWISGTPSLEERMHISDADMHVKHVNERFQTCLGEFKPDVVHFHTPQYFSLTLIRLAKETGARIVITLHDFWWICPKQFYAPELGKKCMAPGRNACSMCMAQTNEGDYAIREEAIANVEKLVDCFVCVSTVMYREVTRIKPYLKEKMTIIPNPVMDNIEKVPEIEGPLTFAFLGGQSDIKGYSVVMNAFKDLPVNLEWQLNVYGCKMQTRVNTTQTKSNILNKARKYLFHPVKLIKKLRVIVRGARAERKQGIHIRHMPPFPADRRREILSHTHVVLMCSQVQESFSLVTYEAMSNGCCVISTPCGGPTDVIKNGINGIVLEDFEAESLKRAVCHILTRPDLVEAYRKKAHELSRTFWNQKDVARQYCRAYEE